MSINLTEAVDVLYDWLWEPDDPQPRESCAKIVDDIAVIIERQVREQIAVEIEAARDWRANNFVGVNSSAISDTYSESACIARGGAA